MYSVHCNLESSGTQFSAIRMRVSTSSLSEQRLKGNCCESDMPLYKWKVTWNCAYSPFNICIHQSNSSFYLWELSLCHTLKFFNPNIFAAYWCKPLIFQTFIICSNRIDCLKYPKSTTLGCKDIGIRKSECSVAKIKFLQGIFNAEKLSSFKKF